MRHPATYCWPPFLAIGPIILGHLLGATRPEVLRRTHGYFEMAAVIGFLAAVVYVLRLRKHHADPRLRSPLHLNLGFILLVVAGGFLTWFAGRGG